MDQTRETAIRLTDAGGFQIERDGRAIELSFDPYGRETPWSATVFDGRGHCLHAEHFAELDAGLDRLADLGEVARTGLRELYRVELPEGRSFQRPGALPAEAVLHLLGFDFYDNVAASLVAPKREAADQRGAVAWFREKLGVLAPLLRNVELAAVEGAGEFWCAEILLSVNGFYQPRGLLEFARTSVGACGVEMLSELGAGEDGCGAAAEPAVLPFAARA